jgi:hypothetical protein
MSGIAQSNVFQGGCWGRHDVLCSALGATMESIFSQPLL